MYPTAPDFIVVSRAGFCMSALKIVCLPKLKGYNVNFAKSSERFLNSKNV